MKQRSKSSHYDPNRLGYTRTTMIVTMRNNIARWSKSLKAILVRIIFCNKNMKAESLVIAKENVAVNIKTDLSTHRPSRHGSWHGLKMQVPAV